MPKVNHKFVYLVLALTITTTLLGYFGRPRPPAGQLVSPQQELPNYEAHYPGDTSLANRLVSTYGLAMVLVQTPYTNKNVVGLESLRSWARVRFQQQPDFLHPVSLPLSTDSGKTLIDSFAYNLLAGPRYWCQEKLGSVLQWRIASFHDTNAYLSFRNAYFDLFGLSNDSAVLLALYQTERAKEAIDLLLGAIFWAVAAVAGLVYVCRQAPRKRFDAAQRVLASAWMLVALSYLVSACTDNQASYIVGAILAAGFGAWLAKPFVFFTHDNVLSIRFVNLPFNMVALALFVTYSLLCIQVLTWIRFGSMLSPDPVTLFLACFSGNFLQEPVHAKRLITQIAGCSWIVVGAWTATQLAIDAKAAQENEETLAAIETNTRVLSR